MHNLEIGRINFELPYIRQLWMFLFQIWHAYVNLSPVLILGVVYIYILIGL